MIIMWDFLEETLTFRFIRNNKNIIMIIIKSDHFSVSGEKGCSFISPHDLMIPSLLFFLFPSLFHLPSTDKRYTVRLTLHQMSNKSQAHHSYWSDVSSSLPLLPFPPKHSSSSDPIPQKPPDQNSWNQENHPMHLVEHPPLPLFGWFSFSVWDNVSWATCIIMPIIMWRDMLMLERMRDEWDAK